MCKHFSEEENDDDFQSVYTLGINRGAMSDIIYVNPLIENRELTMELDTGSAVSVISKQVYQEMFSDVPLSHTTNIKLTTYTGESVAPLGDDANRYQN